MPPVLGKPVSKLKGGAKLFAISSILVGANPSAVQMELQKNYGIMMNAKDLRNLKQSMSAISKYFILAGMFAYILS